MIDIEITTNTKNTDLVETITDELSPTDTVNMLVKYLLGDNWYIESPVSGTQANSFIVKDIMRKYPNAPGAKKKNEINLFGLIRIQINKKSR